jgi:hypothetical protein
LVEDRFEGSPSLLVEGGELGCLEFAEGGSGSVQSGSGSVLCAFIFLGFSVLFHLLKEGLDGGVHHPLDVVVGRRVGNDA